MAYRDRSRRIAGDVVQLEGPLRRHGRLRGQAARSSSRTRTPGWNGSWRSRCWMPPRWVSSCQKMYDLPRPGKGRGRSDDGSPPKCIRPLASELLLQLGHDEIRAHRSQINGSCRSTAFWTWSCTRRLPPQHCADQSGDSAFIGEDADDIGRSPYLLVQAFQRVRRMDLGPVLGGEVHVCQYVGLAIVDECSELRPFHPKLVGHMSQGLAGAWATGVDERLAQRR
jgi:hypothetical protein